MADAPAVRRRRVRGEDGEQHRAVRARVDDAEPSSSNQPFVFSADKIQHYMGLIFLRLNLKIQPQNSASIEAEF